MNNNLDNQTVGFAVCDSCGELLQATATFCPNCGSRKISKGGQEQQELPFQGSMAYHNADFNTPVVSAHENDVFADNGGMGSYYSESPADEEEYAYEEEEEYGEDDYLPVPSLSSVRITVTAGFLITVFTVAVIGLMISFFPHSDAVKDGTQGDDYSVSDTPSAVSSEKPVVHKLPDDVLDDSRRIFSVDNNKFGSAAASSYIDEKITKGSTELAFDGDPKTCWQDGADGYGEGEWLIAFNEDQSAVNVSSVTVYNGYQNTKYNTKTKDMYKINSRVSDFTLEFDDGTTLHFSLDDEKEPQTFRFPERQTCYVRFIIDGVYKGKKYKDTCIGEIIYK